MVAYSFQPQFIMPIETRRKQQTLRDIGKRHHAKVGSGLQLYTGMRTRACRKIGDATCVELKRLLIDFDRRLIFFTDGGGIDADGLDDFARSDGFTDWTDLRNFWSKHHPGVRHWNGIMIRWGDTFVSAA